MRTRELLAMRRQNPAELQEMLAHKAVQRGIDWLADHAPLGWHRNLFEPMGDRAVFRARVCMDNASPLALAFESRKDLSNSSGYVTYATVARHYGLGTRKLILLGFDPPFLRRRPHVTLELLDKVWEETLRSWSRVTVPHKYYLPNGMPEIPLRERLKLPPAVQKMLGYCPQ